MSSSGSVMLDGEMRGQGSLVGDSFLREPGTLVVPTSTTCFYVSFFQCLFMCGIFRDVVFEAFAVRKEAGATSDVVFFVP